MKKAEKPSKRPVVTSYATAMMGYTVKTNRCRKEGRDLVCREGYEMVFY